MKTPSTHPESGPPAVTRLLTNLAKVTDAIRRVHDNLGGEVLNPALCATIDALLAKAIVYLATSRAIVITEGQLSRLEVDAAALADLDADIYAELDRLGVPRAEGGAS